MTQSLSPPPPAPVGDFPVLGTTVDGLKITYLDNAATTLKPQPVIDAVLHYYTEVGANIHRGKHRLSEDASTAYEEARARVAEFIGAATSEVVFVRNTTDGLNMVCNGLGLGPDDLVLVAFDGHHSNMLPWRRRAAVAYVGVHESGEVDLDHYAALLERRPRVVALNHCSNVTGLVAPIEEMTRMAKAVDAVVVADLAQTVPHQSVRVRELGVDFAAFSGHKMLAPTGIGVLYGCDSALRELDPLEIGGGVVDWVDLEQFVYRELPHRFEPGTPHIAGAYGLHAAIDYLDHLGMDCIAEHGRALGAWMVAKALERPYLHLVGQGDEGGDRTSIVSFTIAGIENLDETARMLSDAYGIMCRSGHLCAQPLVASRAGAQVLRASAYIYNTADDVDALFDALDELHSGSRLEDR